MKKTLLVAFNISLLLFPNSFVWADPAASAAAKAAAIGEAKSFLATLNDVFLFPLIYLLSGIAFLVFVYGAAVYIINASSEQAREQGKSSITYGIIGLVIMSSAYAILSIAAGTFSLTIP